MTEVLQAEWFDLAPGSRDAVWQWMHEDYLPALNALQGVAWVGHYDIVPIPDRPYIEGAPRRKETDDASVPTGWQNVVLTAAISPEVFFGKNNPLDALRAGYAGKLEAWQGYRSAVFLEEQAIGSPEQRAAPYGMGPPPAMQIGSYNTDAPEWDVELARWYRAERFPRVSISRGMVRGRKLISMAGWAKHGVLWEFSEMADDEFSFEKRFIEADRKENWGGPHVLNYVTHAPGSPHAGKRVWPKV